MEVLVWKIPVAGWLRMCVGYNVNREIVRLKDD